MCEGDIQSATRYRVWFEIRQLGVPQRRARYIEHHSSSSSWCSLISFPVSIVVDKSNTMLGSFGPQADPHVVVFPRHGWDEAPSGMLARGDYKAKSQVGFFLFLFFFFEICVHFFLFYFHFSLLMMMIKIIWNTNTLSQSKNNGNN